MADPTHIQMKEACPVAPLAEEARRLLQAYAAIEAARQKDVNAPRLEAMRQASWAWRLGLENHATFLRAASAKGAMFQLSLLGDIIEDLAYYAEVEADDCRPSQKAAVDKANRLLYSVASYLESASGISLEDAIGGLWMARRLDPFEHVREALAFASAEEAPPQAPLAPQDFGVPASATRRA